MKKNWKSGMAAVLVCAAAVFAGPAPTAGDLLADECNVDLGLVETAFDTRGQAIVDAAAAKLAQLDDRGASDKKLTQEAAKFALKLTKLETDCIKVANKTAQKCFVKLANLDELTLIDQITLVDTVRDGTISDIQNGEDNLQDAITGALQDEIAD